jgi:hypothetical protein
MEVKIIKVTQHHILTRNYAVLNGETMISLHSMTAYSSIELKLPLGVTGDCQNFSTAALFDVITLFSISIWLQ